MRSSRTKGLMNDQHSGKQKPTRFDFNGSSPTQDAEGSFDDSSLSESRPNKIISTAAPTQQGDEIISCNVELNQCSTINRAHLAQTEASARVNKEQQQECSADLKPCSKPVVPTAEPTKPQSANRGTTSSCSSCPSSSASTTSIPTRSRMESIISASLPPKPTLYQTISDCVLLNPVKRKTTAASGSTLHESKDGMNKCRSHTNTSINESYWLSNQPTWTQTHCRRGADSDNYDEYLGKARLPRKGFGTITDRQLLTKTSNNSGAKNSSALILGEMSEGIRKQQKQLPNDSIKFCGTSTGASSSHTNTGSSSTMFNSFSTTIKSNETSPGVPNSLTQDSACTTTTGVSEYCELTKNTFSGEDNDFLTPGRGTMSEENTTDTTVVSKRCTCKTSTSSSSQGTRRPQSTKRPGSSAPSNHLDKSQRRDATSRYNQPRRSNWSRTNEKIPVDDSMDLTRSSTGDHGSSCTNACSNRIKSGILNSLSTSIESNNASLKQDSANTTTTGVSEYSELLATDALSDEEDDYLTARSAVKSEEDSTNTTTASKRCVCKTSKSSPIHDDHRLNSTQRSNSSAASNVPGTSEGLGVFSRHNQPWGGNLPRMKMKIYKDRDVGSVWELSIKF